jgi:hypothetical protein
MELDYKHLPRYEKILRHACNTIHNAELHSEPFWHFYTRDILPAEVYQDLLANMPPAECHQPIDLAKYIRADGTSTRDQFMVTERFINELLPAACHNIVCPIYAALSSYTFCNEVLKKLRPGIEERLRDTKANMPPTKSDIRFMRDTEDYEIKPHRDGLSKLITMQIYLPPDDSTPDLGTSIYKAKQPHFPRQSMAEVEQDNFVEVKRFPFLPNSAYAFVVSNGPQHVSWHGRQKLAGFKGVRNTLMVLFQQL